MPRIIDYPRGSLRAALQLAEAVDGFAGNCSIELAAEKMGKKVSGAFAALIGAANKYGLVDNKGKKLSTTALYREYKLAYTPEESAQFLSRALLSPRLFHSIYERFKGQKLPISHFEKMLVREFDVPQEIASRVGGYFLEGAKQVGLLQGEVLAVSDTTDSATNANDELDDDQEAIKNAEPFAEAAQKGAIGNESSHSEGYWINIRGVGMNFSIEIKDSDDLAIVEVMLRKISKALKSAEVDEL